MAMEAMSLLQRCVPHYLKVMLLPPLTVQYNGLQHNYVLPIQVEESESESEDTGESTMMYLIYGANEH